MDNEKASAQHVTQGDDDDEDNNMTIQQQQQSQYPSQSFPSSVRRKPVATTTTVNEQPLPPIPSPSQAQAPTSKPETTQTSTHPLPPPSTYIPTSSRPRSRSRLTTFSTRLRTRWILLNKRTKIILVCCIILFFLILIIGLAAGLSASNKHKASNLPLPSSHGGPYTGDLTYYAPGLGACGVTSSNGDAIVAVSHLLFDAVSTGSNPNANPLCGKKIRARRDNKSVDVTVVDRCVGCQARDLDVTETTFAELASVDQGRVTVEWAWLEDVPGTVTAT